MSVVNDKGDNEVKLGAVHRSPRSPSDEDLRLAITSNEITYPQTTSVGFYSKPGRKGGGERKRKSIYHVIKQQLDQTRTSVRIVTYTENLILFVQCGNHSETLIY